ncbi:FAD-binding oxidoreductase [Herbaspirillum sp. RV1423]|uniref:NAD(P)/FAD-dependent oxidoreductase n=1 Tax=Herbaspirillum sp. RV1423 TaxID=1443993 RepID=UPI0004AFF069|nr:FAD-binding oxidoreductase [Herbaspirillum sp. RV1423]
MPQITIVGAGLIGLSCAWRAQMSGWDVTIIDRQFDGDRASHGNAGGIAVSESTPMAIPGFSLKVARWLLDPLGPLSIRPAHAFKLLPWFIAFNQVNKPENFKRLSFALASLNNRVYDDFLPMLKDLGISDHLHRRGALTVYESERSFQSEAAEWAWKRELGVKWRAVSRDEIRVLEPNLAPLFSHGLMIEDWGHINDPKKIVEALRSAIISRGAILIPGEVARLDLSNRSQPAAIHVNGKRIAGDKLLVANGAWAGRLAATVGDRVLIESERGYNTTLPDESRRLHREVIFADRKFVATPLQVGLRIGGAAEFAGLDAPPNYRRSDALMRLARRYIPGMSEQGAQQWMGNRPTTPDSIPVLGPSPQSPNLLYAFGHGHLGLTQAATTAAIINDLICENPTMDLSEFSVARFGKAA